MGSISIVENVFSNLVTTWWTPVFVVIFVAIVTYALWPRNRSLFDRAARMPLED